MAFKNKFGNTGYYRIMEIAEKIAKRDYRQKYDNLCGSAQTEAYKTAQLEHIKELKNGGRG